MSLRGVISCENPEDIGGFAAAVSKFKSAINDLNGGVWDPHNASDFTNLNFEGIVQGEIKLQAINDWKTTLFYGFSDASQNVGFNGTNASAILKFSNTVMNVFGYTLGGTGPASKKMYGGSNLSGFNIQFKWYTPYMEGWREAIRILSFLAWPSSPLNSTDPSQLATEVKTPNEADKAAQEETYKQIIANCTAHRKAIQQFRALLDSCHTTGMSDDEIMAALGKKFGQGQTFAYKDLNQCGADATIIAVNGNVGRISSIEDNLRASFALDGVLMNTASARGDIQLLPTDVGNLILDAEVWYDLGPEVPVNPSAPKLKGQGDKSTPVKETNTGSTESAMNYLPGGNVLSAAANIASGIGDLFKGLIDSFAVNPPKINLKIYSGTELKYEFTPLVITTWAVTASRETINGDPVILTIDLSFDYYQINATGALQAPKQTFAGVPIFRTGEE